MSTDLIIRKFRNYWLNRGFVISYPIQDLSYLVGTEQCVWFRNSILSLKNYRSIRVSLLNQQRDQKVVFQTGVERSVVFPKNIRIYDVADFQRRVPHLFAPLNIQIDFRVTRHNRVEIRWLFPQEAIHYQC